MLITRVHGDKDSAWPDQVDFSSLKNKALLGSRERWQNGENLLSDNWQHFNVDAVEFIKTTPSTSLLIKE